MIFFDRYDSQFNERGLKHMENQNIQLLTLREGKSGNVQKNDNVPNDKLKSHYNDGNLA